MSQIDWLLKEHLSGNHLQGNQIPGLPYCFPFIEGRYVADSGLGLSKNPV